MAMLPPGLSQHQQQLRMSQAAARDGAGVPVMQANMAKEAQGAVQRESLGRASLDHRVALAKEVAMGAQLDTGNFSQADRAQLFNAQARAGLYSRLPTGGQYVAGLASEMLPVA